MRTIPRGALLAFVLMGAGPAVVTSSLAMAAEPAVYAGFPSGLAVDGYAPVAYFVEGRPVAGSPACESRYADATWRFASAANKAAFDAEPGKYAPRYGGYCAWAVSQGYTAKGDPANWRIVGGRLYLNYDAAVQRTWEKDIPGNIRKADGNWPEVVR